MGEMSEGTTPVVRRRRWLTRVRIAGFGLVVAAILVGGFLCWFLGIHSREDVLAYRCMRAERFHPIWKDLALRRIRKGDDLAETIKKHPPFWQEKYGPYTILSYHRGAVSFSTLIVVATNGVLIDARARSCCWQHVFFESLPHQPAIGRAYALHLQQMSLDGEAWHIHLAIQAGQDVFRAEQVQCREAVRKHQPAPNLSEEMKRQYKQVYGEDIERLLSEEQGIEVTAVVSDVLYGNLRAGSTVTFWGADCRNVDLAEPSPVFLHTDDSRTIYAHSEGGELYTTVSNRALAWYLSLTADELKELEARCLTHIARMEGR